VWDQVLDEWESVLGDLERDPALTADRLDWVAKRASSTATWSGTDSRTTIRSCAPSTCSITTSTRPRAVSPAGRIGSHAPALHRRGGGGGDVEPPERTRAWFRGTCVDRFSESMVAANWDSLVFDIGEPHLKRVPMMEPLRGSKEVVGPLLDSVETAAELLQALEG
jgi:Pup amidohydrolase